MLQLRAFFDGDRAGNNRLRNPADLPQSKLGAHNHLGPIFILTQKQKLQDDLQGLSICSHHDERRDNTVESFGGFIGSFPKLLLVT